jgi:signal transduction histidine kinase
MRNVIHEIKNHLAVAVANVEAFRDGVFEASPARLAAVLQALAEADMLLSRLPHDSATATFPTSTGAGCRRFGGDPVRVAEIVNNVVSNAIRYTPVGGRVEVDCRGSDGTLMLSVSDSGPGIADVDRERIFAPGYRGGAASGTTGSGLGLALAKRFAEDHGGSIEILNANGSGARFVVKLPGTQLSTIAHEDADGALSLL